MPITVAVVASPRPFRGASAVKVVLTRPAYRTHIVTPPLGIGYLSSFLQAHGIDVVLIDALRDSLPLSSLIERIVAERPDAVGVTCLTAHYHESVALCQAVRSRGLRCIVGGVHPTFLPYQTLLDSGADFVVCGEGEQALLALVASGFADTSIPGVYTQHSLPMPQEVHQRAAPVTELDSLPYPDWRQMRPSSYPRAPHGAVARRFPIGVITTTRGCPYACAFCASPGMCGRSIRFRSPANVVDEIAFLVREFGVREIHFEDDNLTLRREHVASICESILQRGLRLTWACPNGIRADRVDEPLLRLMHRAGCYCVAFGVESASPQILTNIGKHETIEAIREGIEAASRVGISCQGFFIFGLPGETADTIEETINFALSSRLSRAQFLILDVLPGSALWYELQGSFAPNWGKGSYREPEWLPPGISREQLLRAQSRAFRRFYGRPSILLGMLRSVRPSQLSFLVQRLRDYRVLSP